MKLLLLSVVVVALAHVWLTYVRPVPHFAKPTVRGKIVAINDVPVHIVKVGKPNADKRVLLLHGFGAHSFYFKSIQMRLSEEGFETCTFDFEGHGHSGVDPRATQFDRYHYIKQVARVMHHLGWNADTAPAITLLGYSMGGGVAALFAEMYPEQVRSLILVAPVALPFTLPWTARVALVPGLGEAVMSLLGERVQYQRYSTMLTRRDVPSQVRQEFVDNAMGIIQESNRAGSNDNDSSGVYWRVLLRTLRDFPMDQGLQDTVHALARHHRPTLIMWGDGDSAIPFAHAQALHASLSPHAQLQVFPGAGHVPMLEDSVMFDDTVVTFCHAHHVHKGAPAGNI